MTPLSAEQIEAVQRLDGLANNDPELWTLAQAMLTLAVAEVVELRAKLERATVEIETLEAKLNYYMKERDAAKADPQATVRAWRMMEMVKAGYSFEVEDDKTCRVHHEGLRWTSDQPDLDAAIDAAWDHLTNERANRTILRRMLDI